MLSATAHALMSGLTPSALLAAAPRSSWGLLALISVAGVVPLGRRRQPWWVNASALTAMQLAQHVVLVGAGPATHHTATMPSAGHHVVRMMLGHAVAAVLTALIAERGERAVALLRHRLRWLAPRWTTPADLPDAASPAFWSPVPVPVAGLVPGGRGLRGPPVLV